MRYFEHTVERTGEEVVVVLDDGDRFFAGWADGLAASRAEKATRAAAAERAHAANPFWASLAEGKDLQDAMPWAAGERRTARQTAGGTAVGAAPVAGAGRASGGGLRAGAAAVPEALTALFTEVEAVAAQVPRDLTQGEALEQARALMALSERLRTTVLDRLADIDQRRLYRADGAGSTASWAAAQPTSVDSRQVALATRLGRSPAVAEALRQQRLSVEQARRVAAAVATLRRHVDRPDGLVDGQDGEQVVTAVVVDGVLDVVCEARAGLADDDPLVLDLLATLSGIAASGLSQLTRLEQALVVLAGHIETGLLPSALSRLLDALLPHELERRAADGHDDRGFGMRRKSDGSGWTITDGELDLETGELLQTVLAAEMAVDPDSPADTAGYAALREQGWQSGDPLPSRGGPRPGGAGLEGDATTAAGTAAAGPDAGPDATAPDAPGPDAAGPDAAGFYATGPRSLRKQRHDALRNGLRRLLDSGALGLRDKVAPHLSATVGVGALDGTPGALPARGASGATLPASLVRRWACDSQLTRLVLSLGRRVLEASHTQRTLTGIERRIKYVEAGGRCQGSGCCHGPGVPLVPHHANPFAKTGTTRLDDTVLFCQQTHRDLHTGGTSIRLKDGRLLGPDGWITDG